MKYLPLLLIVWLADCVPLPTPGPIPATPKTTPDIFAQYRADCSDVSVAAQKSLATMDVRHCFDGNTPADSCLVDATSHLTKDSIVCTVVDLNVQWQREVAPGTASPQTKQAALQSNEWIYKHQIGVRR